MRMTSAVRIFYFEEDKMEKITNVEELCPKCKKKYLIIMKSGKKRCPDCGVIDDDQEEDILQRRLKKINKVKEENVKSELKYGININ